jgi:hypothetical protein
MAYAYVKRHIDEYMEYFFGSFAEPAEKQVVAGGLRNGLCGAREKWKCGSREEKFSRGACVGKISREKKENFSAEKIFVSTRRQFWEWKNQNGKEKDLKRDSCLSAGRRACRCGGSSRQIAKFKLQSRAGGCWRERERASRGLHARARKDKAAIFCGQRRPDKKPRV